MVIKVDVKVIFNVYMLYTIFQIFSLSTHLRILVLEERAIKSKNILGLRMPILSLF